MKKLIPRNTTIPVRRSDTFSTSENNQTVVEVHILQGEREMVDDNKSLGRFKLMGIPPAPRGIPQVQVSFDIDANGILQVSALDKTTGRQQSITVQEASNLSEAEIQDMIRAAEENAATDRLQRDRVEKRNRAEALTFKAERVLREVAIDFGMQFGRDRRRRIENLVQQLRAALEQSDDRGIDMFQADLQNEVYELNREAYLYDLDEEGEGILGAIGNTIKQAFSGDDDDYYRTGDYGYGAGSGYGTSYPASSSGYAASNPYGQQAQWDAPSWNQGNSGNASSWDDWDDDWESSRRSQSPPPARYNPPEESYNQAPRYDQAPYAPSDGRSAPSDRGSRYSQDSYSQGQLQPKQWLRPRTVFRQRRDELTAVQTTTAKEATTHKTTLVQIKLLKKAIPESIRKSAILRTAIASKTPVAKTFTTRIALVSIVKIATHQNATTSLLLARMPTVKQVMNGVDYPQGDYPQGDYSQDSYSQDSYSQDTYSQDSYSQDSYSQKNYRPRRPQPDYDREDYAPDQRPPQDRT